MPENKDEHIDAVKREDYNKVVELHNSLKTENEFMKKKMDEISSKMQINEEKEAWKREAEDIKRSIEEIKSKSDERKETKVSKGVVQNKIEEQPANIETFKNLLNKQLPDREVNPEKFGSRIRTYGYYKNGATKAYTRQQLGMALSLSPEAIKANPGLLSQYAFPSKNDIRL